MIIWGVISTATAGCRNASDLYLVRFCLGFVEAAYFPGCELQHETIYTLYRLKAR